MYFNLPKTDKCTENDNNNLKRSDCTSDERMSEIRDNVEDHWGSPPLLTPETLAYILENQWVSDDNDSSSNSLKKRIKKKNELIQNLITELYKTMEIIDSEKEHKITKELD
ncbi:hypothetical protein K501DRAFT_62383 [Backusella circina FSU 941]|nr:hypothetical protein K501DRAFT_62383 [Backusella circina FSU 941]